MDHYGFNPDRSKVEIYSKQEIDNMDLANDQALAQEVADRQAAVSEEASTRATADNLLGTRIDNILIGYDDDPNKDSELVDIRTGYDSTTYASAGDAVRKQRQDLDDYVAEVAGLIPLEFDEKIYTQTGDYQPGDTFLYNLEVSLAGSRHCLEPCSEGNLLIMRKTCQPTLLSNAAIIPWDGSER